MVTMSIVVVFSAHHSLLGPLLLGMVGGWHRTCAEEWAWIPFNVATLGLATLLAAVAYRALRAR
jgi:hypothetical protein